MARRRSRRSNGKEPSVAVTDTAERTVEPNKLANDTIRGDGVAAQTTTIETASQKDAPQQPLTSSPSTLPSSRKSRSDAHGKLLRAVVVAMGHPAISIGVQTSVGEREHGNTAGTTVAAARHDAAVEMTEETQRSLEGAMQRLLSVQDQPLKLLQEYRTAWQRHVSNPVPASSAIEDYIGRKHLELYLQVMTTAFEQGRSAMYVQRHLVALCNTTRLTKARWARQLDPARLYAMFGEVAINSARFLELLRELQSLERGSVRLSLDIALHQLWESRDMRRKRKDRGAAQLHGVAREHDWTPWDVRDTLDVLVGQGWAKPARKASKRPPQGQVLATVQQSEHEPQQEGERTQPGSQSDRALTIPRGGRDDASSTERNGQDGTIGDSAKASHTDDGGPEDSNTATAGTAEENSDTANGAGVAMDTTVDHTDAGLTGIGGEDLEGTGYNGDVSTISHVPAEEETQPCPTENKSISFSSGREVSNTHGGGEAQSASKHPADDVDTTTGHNPQVDCDTTLPDGPRAETMNDRSHSTYASPDQLSSVSLQRAQSQPGRSFDSTPERRRGTSATATSRSEHFHHSPGVAFDPTPDRRDTSPPAQPRTPLNWLALVAGERLHNLSTSSSAQATDSCYAKAAGDSNLQPDSNRATLAIATSPAAASRKRGLSQSYNSSNAGKRVRFEPTITPGVMQDFLEAFTTPRHDYLVLSVAMASIHDLIVTPSEKDEDIKATGSRLCAILPASADPSQNSSESVADCVVCFDFGARTVTCYLRLDRQGQSDTAASNGAKRAAFEPVLRNFCNVNVLPCEFSDLEVKLQSLPPSSGEAQDMVVSVVIALRLFLQDREPLAPVSSMWARVIWALDKQEPSSRRGNFSSHPPMPAGQSAGGGTETSVPGLASMGSLETLASECDKLQTTIRAYFDYESFLNKLQSEAADILSAISQAENSMRVYCSSTPASVQQELDGLTAMKNNARSAAIRATYEQLISQLRNESHVDQARKSVIEERLTTMKDTLGQEMRDLFDLQQRKNLERKNTVLAARALFSEQITRLNDYD